MSMTCEYPDGCESLAEPGTPFCAFHDELSDRNEVLDPRAQVPLAEMSGAMRWDGYGHLKSKLALRPEPEVPLLPAKVLEAARSDGMRRRGLLRGLRKEEREKELRVRFQGNWVLELGLQNGKNGYLFAPRGAGGMKAGPKSAAKLQRLGDALLKGLSLRAAAREAGCSKNTARKLHEIFLTARGVMAIGDLRCPCGKSQTHRGFCTFRLRNSEHRDKVLATLEHCRRRKSA